MFSSIVVYQSLSGNTKKIADAIAQGADTKAVRVNEIKESELAKAEIIFLGSGIYGGLHHRQIIDLVKKIDPKTKVFVFSTAGIPAFKFIWHKKLKMALVKKKIKVIGEVSFKGFDTFGPLKFFGGMNRKRPNENDLKKARELGKKVATC
jgi:flavodoxin